MSRRLISLDPELQRLINEGYARLREVEAKLEADVGERDALLDELDELDRVTHRIAVPLSYAEELYALRNNIHAVRKRLLAQHARATAGTIG